MTREEFIDELDKLNYSYRIEGDKIVVYEEDVFLGSLKTLPSDVVFRNPGYADLGSLETLPSGVKFKNGGNVNLDSLKTLPPDVEFKNGRDVFLNSLKTLPPDVEFKNGRDVNLGLLIGGWFDEWNGSNINGIDNKVLLNGMIKRGLFL